MTSKPVILLGEAWGQHEEKLRTGFVGASGVELLNMLDEAGLLSLSAEDTSFIAKFWESGDPSMIDMVWRMHPEFYRTNVFNLHPHANKLETLCGPKAEALLGYPALIKGKWAHSSLQAELDRLGEELVDLDPNLIICLGNTPLWALAGKTGITKLRGTTIESTHTAAGFKLLPTYHPAAVLRQYELRPVAVMDLMKARREAAFPEIRRPQRLIWTEPSLDDIRKFINDHILEEATQTVRCRCLSVDIETAGSQVTIVGLAPSPTLALVIPFFDERAKGRSYWPTAQAERQAWGLIAGVLSNQAVKKVFQNGLYDIAFLLRSVGIGVRGTEHDTMLLHHALQPESLKGLGFLGSIYTDEGPWKNERKHVSTIKRDE